MNTTITTEHERRITIDSRVLTVLNTETGCEIHTILTDEQRRTLAAALDPDRAAGGQWTRDDFARLDIHPMSTQTTVRDEVAAWLNAHHPKPAPYDQGGWPKPGTPEQLVRMCNDADLKRVRAEDARDAAVERTARRDEEIDLIARQCAEARAARDAAVARAEGLDRDYRECQESLIEVSLERDGWKAGGQEWELLAKQERARAEKAEDRVRALEAAPARSTWCPKILLELLRAQSIYSPDEVTGDAIQTLGRVIAQHRPVGPDGKHGDRHTASCGCEDLGAVYPVVDVQSRATVADTKLEDEATSFGYWVAKQLGCHVDYLDGLTLVGMSKRVVEKAERERDEADRRTAAAEADRDRWKLHHDRVDGQWAKAEREVTRLRGTGAVTKAGTVTRSELAEAIRQGWWLGSPHAVLDAVDELVSGDDPAVHVIRESDIAAVKVKRSRRGWDTDKYAYTGDATAQEARSGAKQNIDYAIACEAIARAIEDEQAVDPVEKLARELHQAVRASSSRPTRVWDALPDEGTDSYLAMARHVLGQEADQ